jgi:hypothetical protein
MAAQEFGLLDVVLIAMAAAITIVMLRPAIRESPFWRATVTPLASIIGSGFLVVVPLLAGSTGKLSVVAIVGIVLLSFWIGAAIRFNILNGERPPGPPVPHRTKIFERLSNLTLTCAYVVSITFYVRLMCGFVLAGVGIHTALYADILATLVLGFIGGYGFWRGLRGLEQLEEYSVTIKLSIIAALLFGLACHDVRHGYDLSGMPAPKTDWLESLRQLGGILLIVQGFETSKYMGSSYPAPLRVRSMWVAQVVAGVIYVVFVALAMPLMAPMVSEPPSETAIISLTRQITLVLPVMLVIGAAMSQISAAIADTIGAGGVVEEETRRGLSARRSYLAITAMAIALLWSSSVFEIVALASRAFALYYFVQVSLAATLAFRITSGRRRVWLVCSFTALAMVLLVIVLFAKSVAA